MTDKFTSGYLLRTPRTEEQARADIAKLRKRYAHVLLPWNQIDLPALIADDGSYEPPRPAMEPGHGHRWKEWADE